MYGRYNSSNNDLILLLARFTAAIGLIKRSIWWARRYFIRDRSVCAIAAAARRGGFLVVHTVSNSVRTMYGRSWRMDRDRRNVLDKSWWIHHIGDIFSFRIATYGIRRTGILPDEIAVSRVHRFLNHSPLFIRRNRSVSISRHDLIQTNLIYGRWMK